VTRTHHQVFLLRLVLGAALCAAPAVAADPGPSPKEPSKPEQPTGEDAPAPTEPSAKVRVRSIGLHIGGGPNDAATKAPFQKAIAAALTKFAQCHAHAETKAGTFGVDLLVLAEGGPPKVSDVRTGMKGDAFVACVVSVFENIAFEKPRRGATRLSTSLGFDVED
jgi:hypothetical protein